MKKTSNSRNVKSSAFAQRIAAVLDGADAAVDFRSKLLAVDDLPIVSLADAVGYLRTAAQAERNDAGIERAYRILTARLASEGGDDGSHAPVLSYSDLKLVRDHVGSIYHTSRIAHVMEQVALASLPEGDAQAHSHLARIASLAANVHDTASFEAVVEASGLGGDDLGSIQARHLLAAFAEGASAANHTPAAKPSALARIAQAIEKDIEPDAIEGVVVAPDGIVEGVADGEGDEESVANSVSPNSGEPIHIKLETSGQSVAEGEGHVDGDEMSDDDAMSVGEDEDERSDESGLSPLEDEVMSKKDMAEAGPFQMVGQLQDMAPPEHTDELAADPSNAVEVMLDDPTQPGAKIRMILRPDEPAPGASMEEEMPPVDGGEIDHGEGGVEGPGSKMASKSKRASTRTASSFGGRPYAIVQATPDDATVIERFRARSLRAALVRAAMLSGANGDVSIDQTSRAYAKIAFHDEERELHIVASDQFDVNVDDGAEAAEMPKIPAPAAFLDEDKNALDGELASGEPKAKSASARAPLPPRVASTGTSLVQLTTAQVEERTTPLKLTASIVEATILDGERVKHEASGWSIYVTADSNVAVGKTGSMKSRPMAEFDFAVREFRAGVAAAVGPAHELRFVIGGTDVRERRINAKRALSEVSKVAMPSSSSINPSTGEVILGYSAVPSVRAQARVGSILRGAFRARIADADPASPYVGKPPVARVPAGSPMKPMAPSGQQPAKSGTGQMAEIIAKGTDGLADARKQLAQPKAARLAQVAPPAAPPGVEEMGEMADASAGGPGAPVDPAMEAAAIPPAGTTVPAAIADVGQQTLQEGDEEAIAAAMTHYRNQGLTPLDALVSFAKDYADFLDKYGKKGDPMSPRAAVEASVIRVMADVWSKPAMIRQASTKSAEAKVASESFKSWHEAHAHAIDEANKYKMSMGIEKSGYKGNEFRVFMLRKPENRSGHELRCEVVDPGTPHSGKPPAKQAQVFPKVPSSIEISGSPSLPADAGKVLGDDSSQDEPEALKGAKGVQAPGASVPGGMPSVPSASVIHGADMSSDASANMPLPSKKPKA